MKIGKIPGEKLEKIILDKITFKRDDVLVHAGIGEDSAVVDMGGDLLVISSDPITGAVEDSGYLAVHVACNDLAAAGAVPVGIQVVLLLPDYMTEDDIAGLMDEISLTTAENNIEVLGGHTEILSAVSKPLIIVTAVGKVGPDSYVSSAGSLPGDDIILTKGAGIEGTFILASDFSNMLRDKGVSQATIDTDRKYRQKLSVVKEGITAAGMGAHAMHDVTEGGLYGALEELAEAAGKGFILYMDKLFLTEETAEICEALDIDPAGLISSGSMLIAIPDSKSQELIRKLRDMEIESKIIGKVTEKNKSIKKNGRLLPFEWKKKDELWRLME